MGGQQGRLIARKVRGEGVYCEVLPYDAPKESIVKRAPKGIIVAGGAGDPYGEQARTLPDYVYDMGLPILGIGYGAGVLLRRAGGHLKNTVFGRGTAQVTFLDSPLFAGLTQSERLMDRVDDVALPESCRPAATLEDGKIAAFEETERRVWGMQFMPEQNDPDGLMILRNFAVNICGCEGNWNIDTFLESELTYIRRKVGEGRVLMTLSGGVDSSVCAALLNRAIGDRLICLYVDTGLMRSGENAQVAGAIASIPGITLRKVDASARFLERLKGVRDAAVKRRVVMDELCRVFLGYAKDLGWVECIAQGTTYDDVLSLDGKMDAMHALASESGRFPITLEPVCRLFKDEVRLLGDALGLPPELTRQQSFPGPGLALRCLGDVTEERLTMLRRADGIFREEIEAAGLEKRIRQYFAVLTDLETGDAYGRAGCTLALRAVNWTGGFTTATAYRLPYDLLERVVDRVTREVPGVNRVVYDLTGKPPAGIEWD